ncbi:hypothetical protein ACE3MZ_19375 [Paenibacillus sp. WLX1005]|uniref:hypothetical protein n=1 Tax=Paenibacillus sp. WLX1005 TaxID=3243766 RepID=UPI00398414D2
MKKNIVFLLVLILLSSLIFSQYLSTVNAEEQNEQESKGYPSNISITPKEPSKIQTMKIPLTGQSQPIPKVMWVQTDI